MVLTVSLAQLFQQVQAGDSQISHPIFNQFNHIFGPHEQQGDCGVAHPDGQGTFGLLERQPCFPEQSDGGFTETTFIGHRDAEGFSHYRLLVPLDVRGRSGIPPSRTVSIR